MPISRALLNRLRLPYKALDIQGSKGDVLYVPDDVGIDLSVMHGVHNGDMVPVNTDANGIVSVAVDSVLGSTSVKEQLAPLTLLRVTDISNTIVIDTSKYLNYMFNFVVEFTTDSTAAITIDIGRSWPTGTLEVIHTFIVNAIIGQNHTVFMLSSDTTATLPETFIDAIINHSGKEATMLACVVGYN